MIADDDPRYDRMRYELTFARTKTPRQLCPAGILGPEIPSSRVGDVNRSAEHPWFDDQDGDYDGDIMDWGNDPVRQVFSVAIAEAVHEALEWLKVDDRCVLDPHGEHEAEIVKASRALANRLWRTARQGLPADLR